MPTAPVATVEGNSLILKGDWLLTSAPVELPEMKGVAAVDLRGVSSWDSTLVALVWRLKSEAMGTLTINGAPENLESLLSLAGGAKSTLMDPKAGAAAKQLQAQVNCHRYKAAIWLEKAWAALTDAVTFLGDIYVHLWEYSRKATRKHFRPNDWLLEFWMAGYKALPIISFLSFLTGLIVAFVSAIQLKLFGASIYVADLVGIFMTREMGALMTAIIMAGRTGASYAAEIGSMKRSEELDALKTMGLSATGMVVVPKVVALTLMTPLLSIYATFMGMFAGLLMANSFLDVSVFQYISETAHNVPLRDLFIGIIKAIVYGFLVAFAGAWRGMRCGNSSDGVGKAATSAVVLALTLIVIANAIFAIVLNALNI